MAVDQGRDVVKVAVAPTAIQAHIWRQALADEGIDSHVVGDNLEAGFGDLPGVMPELWVVRADLARAEQILRDKSGNEVQGQSPSSAESES
jgi:hypothetical protein